MHWNVIKNVLKEIKDTKQLQYYVITVVKMSQCQMVLQLT